MAGDEHDDHDRTDEDQRIADAIRSLDAGRGSLSDPPPVLWDRIADAIDEPLDAPLELVPPPADLWGRIAEEVQAEGGTLADPAVVELTAGASAPAAGHRGRLIVGLVAAALVVLAALAAGVVALRSDGGSDVQLVAEASLSGEGLDPGGDSSGAAKLVRDGDEWAVAISVADLPEAPEGTYYEAWLLGGPDQVQSLGALGDDGDFAVPRELDLDEFPLVDVSIEPIDGDPGHSAKSVLRGELQSV